MAVATLVRMMNDPSAAPRAKVTAAAVLLRFGREGVGLDDLERASTRPRKAVPSRAVEPQDVDGDADDEGELT